MAEPLTDHSNSAERRVMGVLRQEFPKRTEFALGVLAHKIVEVARDCPACGGTGTIPAVDLEDSDYQCETCDGDGHAAKDLWRAADAINEARAKLRDSGHGAIRLQAMKVQDMVETLAHKAELAADVLMPEVTDD